MRIQKRSVIALLVLAAVFTLPLLNIAFFNWRAARAADRRVATYGAIVHKLAAYAETHGKFPESLDLLSFTNNPAERAMLPEVRRFDYHLDDQGSFELHYRK